MKTQAELMEQLRSMLADVGIETTVICIAKTGSCYFRFKESFMGKCRIGDHNEKKRLGYRWQIRLDDPNAEYSKQTKGHRQYYYGSAKLEQAKRHMVNYRTFVLRNKDMGQAKNRGTFEQRKEAAIKRDYEAAKALHERLERECIEMTPQQRRSKIEASIMLAALASTVKAYR